MRSRGAKLANENRDKVAIGKKISGKKKAWWDTIEPEERSKIMTNWIYSNTTPEERSKKAVNTGIANIARITSPEYRKMISEKTSGLIWINNGQDHKRIKPNEAIPEGWVKCRLVTWKATTVVRIQAALKGHETRRARLAKRESESE